MRAAARTGGMVNLAEALDLLFGRLGALGAARREEVPLAAGMGRVLAEDVIAERPAPDVPRSAMDGFAISAGDAARLDRPLRLAARVLAGESPPPLPPSATVFVATGARLPSGADRVVPRELADWAPDDGAGQPALGAAVRLRGAAAAGAHVMPAGEWVPSGATALRAGTLLGPAAIGLLGALGRPTAPVRARPLVALLTTGDEVIPPGTPPTPGSTFDSNAAMLQVACAAAGADVRLVGHVADRPEALRSAAHAALDLRPALILSTGGVSVGPADLMPALWHGLGAEEVFWRVAIKPGKPVFAARLGDVAVVGLSGSPTAAWTAFHVFVGPLLRQWAGWRAPFPPAQPVRLHQPLPPNPDVPRLHWARVDADGCAHPPHRRAPGTLVEMAVANGLLLQGAGSAGLAAGAEAWALRIDRLGEEGPEDPRSLLAASARPGGLAAPPDPRSAAPMPMAGPTPGAPWVCAIGGWSGHGKTTLIERLVAHFDSAGEPVATVKHHAHGTPRGAPGKDGFRHRSAGARLTVVRGPGGLLWSEAAQGDTPLQAWLPDLRRRAADAGCAWLLIEGYHDAPLPRVEVLDTTRTPMPRCSAEGGLFLIAADDPAAVAVPRGVQVLPRDDTPSIAAAIRRACVAGQGAHAG